jgi:hypothetical protein
MHEPVAGSTISNSGVLLIEPRWFHGCKKQPHSLLCEGGPLQNPHPGYSMHPRDSISRPQPCPFTFIIALADVKLSFTFVTFLRILTLSRLHSLGDVVQVFACSKHRALR